MAYRPTEATRASTQAKRERLLSAARGIVAEAGFAPATVSAIAERAGVSVGSVYSYFDNRESLLSEVFRAAAEYEFEQVREAVSAAGNDHRAALATFVDTFAERAIRGRRLAWSLLFEPVAPSVERERLRLRESYRELGGTIITGGVAAGVFAEQDVPVVAGAVMGAIAESLVGALNPDLQAATSAAQIDSDAVVATIRRFCFRAVGARPQGA